MRKVRLLLLGILVAAGMLTPAVAAEAASAVQGNVATAQPNASTYGCPSGDVCIYPEGASYKNSNPIVSFYTYGTHPFANLYNYHWIFNNQTGNATVRVCKGIGTQCDPPLKAGWLYWVNFTPYNSVPLEP